MTYQDYSIVPAEAQTPVWVNGKLIPWEEATMQIATHVVNYGSGVFEGVRVYETVNGLSIFHIDEHLDRMMNSCKAFRIESGYSKEQLKQACIDLVTEIGHPGYIRPQIQFGLSKLSLGSTSVVDTTVVYWPMKKYRDVAELKVVTSEIERISPKSGSIEAKVIGFYTNSHFNHEYAKEHGVDEAIMLDVEGNVAEASSSNVFYVKDGVVCTPKPGFFLKGITRQSILEIAKYLNIPAEEKTVTVEDLRSSDEMFLTGTAAEIDPIIEYDGRALSGGDIGPITAKLKETYSKITRGEIAEFAHWHTIVKPA